MATSIQPLFAALSEVLPAQQISTDARTLQANSQDYAWFSNVLEEELGGCCADVVVWPTNEHELANVLAVAHATRTPVTLRGGGTGNYGQCVPLRGGLVVNTSRMNAILELGKGHARVQAGTRFVQLDEAARASGQEICIYPSTYLTATVCGFVAGGSGGVGSITHGVLADGNVLRATVYDVSASPIPTTVEGRDLGVFIHAYGSTGVMSDVTVPLTTRTQWQQAVFSFPDIYACHDFCLLVLDHTEIDKRLLSTAEPEIVRHFLRSRLPFQPERTSAILMIGAGQLDMVQALAARCLGQLDFSLPPDSKTRLTDFTWNHTTLWAKKSDDTLTYLQAGFDLPRFAEQVRMIKAEYGKDFAIHGEYFLAGGAPFASSLPILAYKGRAHLDGVVTFLESIGVRIANPHRYVLEEGSRVENVAELVAVKRRNDPANLLNPGKVRAALAEGEQLGHAFRPATMSLARRRDLDVANA
jgi:FAD/FMN-containing dehydrogenase